MTAARVMWVAGLATLLVVAVVAVSASGLMASALSPGHTPNATNRAGQGWEQSTGPYSVNFTETGLPSGTFWVVQLHQVWAGWQGGLSPAWRGWYGWNHGLVNGSTNSSLGFSVGNGTYDFSVFAAGNASVRYAATPSYGNLTVNGTNVSVSVTFAPITLYPVTFTESGLPAGTFWSVFLHGTQPGGWGLRSFCGSGSGFGGFAWNGSTSTTVTFSLPNGTYDFGVPPAGSNGSLFAASPSSGNFTVNGGSVSVAVTFSAIQLYTVTFVESGLPSGTFWSAQLAGGWGESGWNGSATDSINFTVANGTYYFGVGPAWSAGSLYLPSPGFGNVTVDGSAVTVDVTFTESTWQSPGQGHWE